MNTEWSIVCLDISVTALTLTMLDLDTSNFENSVDIDQLASEKQADLDLLC